MTDKYKPGDKVILVDASRSRGMYKEGSVATVQEHRDGRLYVIFEDENETISGSETRFRLVTPLDELL